MPTFHFTKATLVLSQAGKLRAPDAIIFSKKGLIWAEIKYKRSFTWHRNTARWMFGIDLVKFRDYQDVETITGLPVWIFIGIHGEDEDPVNRGAPGPSPTGIFAGKLSAMREHHRDEKMIYWEATRLARFA